MCYGKTTLVNIIKEFDNSYEILSFGKKVKDIAKDLFNIQNKDMNTFNKYIKWTK